MITVRLVAHVAWWARPALYLAAVLNWLVHHYGIHVEVQ